MELIDITKDADFVVKFVADEHAILLALASALEYWTSPNGQGDETDCSNPTAWRLAQVLHERLSSTEFLNNLDRLLGRAQS